MSSVATQGDAAGLAVDGRLIWRERGIWQSGPVVGDAFHNATATQHGS